MSPDNSRKLAHIAQVLKQERKYEELEELRKVKTDEEASKVIKKFSKTSN